MNIDLKSTQSLPGDKHSRNPGKPFVEEAYTVNEYAYMYYVMTPFSSHQASREKLLD
jgi:hypothetical protein